MASAAELAMLLTLKDQSGPGFAKAEQEVSSFGSKVSSVGSGLATAFGGAALAGIGAVAAGFAVGLDGASQLESATAKLQGQLGLTSEQAQELGTVVEGVFRNNFGESREAVATAVAAIKQNIGDLTPDATKTATETALALESLFDAPVAESSRAVGVMLKNFEGLSETQAFDLITAGFQRGGDFSDDLLDTLSEYAPQFSKLGLSAEQSMGVLIAGAQAGAFNMDKVGDAAKEFAIRAQDGSKLTAEGFKAIGLDADAMSAAIAKGGPAAQEAFQATLVALAAMEDPLARNQAGVALFGTQWEDLGPTVVASMAEGLKGVEGYEGAAARAAATTGQGFSAAVEGLKRAFSGLLVDVVMPLMPGITALVVALTAKLPEAFAAAKAAIEPFMPTIQAVGATILELASAAPEVGSQIGQAFADLAAVVGPAVQEVAGFIVSQFGVVVDWVRENWPLIQQTIQTVLSAIAALWAEYGDEITTVVKAAWEIVKTVISTALANLLDAIKLGMQLINGDWSGAWETIQGMISRQLDAIGTILGAAFDIWYTLVDTQTGGMLTSIGTWMSETEAAISSGMEAVGTAISTGWENAKSTVGSILPAIKDAIMAVWNLLPEDIRTDLEKIATHITTQGATWVSNLTTAGSNMLTAITGKLTEMVTAATTWATSTFLAPIQGLVGTATTTATSVGTGILTSITAKLAEIVTAVTTWASTTFMAPLRNLASAVVGTARSIGQAIVDAISGAINAGAEAIKNAALGALRGALSAAKEALGIHSPSEQWWREVGVPMAQGVMGGFVSQAPSLAKATSDAVRAAILPSIDFTDYAVNRMGQQAMAMAEAARQAAMAAARPSNPQQWAQVMSQLGQTIGNGVSPAIRQFNPLASGSIIPGQIGGGAQYGLIPIGPGTMQSSAQSVGTGAVQQHEHRVRVGDSEAMRIVVVGRELESRVYGSNS